MAISIVNVIVPGSGDGPIADISNLTGPKTVELSGFFKGRYVLMGSHDNANFAPVLIFDAGGEENIKLTLNLALKSVRLRAAATPISGVTLNISGILSPGSNVFTTLGVLTPGMSGLQPPINLAALFPPTGIEQDINFLCEGSFSGLITVRGSMDGIHFNPIDGFRTDDQPDSLNGPAPYLEFSPIVTQDLIRYIQLSIDGTIISNTTVTLGGSNPSSGSSGSSKLIEVSEDEGRAVVGTTEAIVYEWAINLSDLPIGSPINTQINAIIQVDPAQSRADFNVYVGSVTPGDTTGGTLRANLNTSSGTENLSTVIGNPFTNPGGPCLIQITAVGSALTTQASIRAVTVVLIP